MDIYFVAHENVDPSMRGVLANIPGFGLFFLEYFTLEEFFLVFEPDPTIAPPGLNFFKFRVARNVWTKFRMNYDDNNSIFMATFLSADIIKSKRV